MEDYNSIHPGPDIDQGVSDALPGGRLDQAITAAIETAVSRAVAQLAAKYHASQHAADGADPLTPADIGALALAGGDISGRVNITQRLRAAYFEQSSFGTPNELGQYIDMHMANSAADYDGRLFLDSQKKLYYQNYGATAERILTTADMGEGGSGQVYVGTYDGTGSNGSKYPCTIECGFAPKGAIVFNLTDGAQGKDMLAFFVHGQKGIQVGSVSMNDEYGYSLEMARMAGTTWGETALSWYNTVAGGSTRSGDSQMNDSDHSYGVFVWG